MEKINLGNCGSSIRIFEVEADLDGFERLEKYILT